MVGPRETADPACCACGSSQCHGGLQRTAFDLLHKYKHSALPAPGTSQLRQPLPLLPRARVRVRDVRHDEPGVLERAPRERAEERERRAVDVRARGARLPARVPRRDPLRDDRQLPVPSAAPSQIRGRRRESAHAEEHPARGERHLRDGRGEPNGSAVRGLELGERDRRRDGGGRVLERAHERELRGVAGRRERAVRDRPGLREVREVRELRRGQR
jgi:hypothetical protein